MTPAAVSAAVIVCCVSVTIAAILFSEQPLV
jgi:hypothetical protein